MFHKRQAKLGKSVLPLAMAVLMAVGTTVTLAVDDTRCCYVVIEFERCLARSWQDM